MWDLFDKALVLSKGYQLFYGLPHDSPDWFKTGLGLSFPPGIAPVDFIVDICNVDFDKSLLPGYEHTFRTVDDIQKVGHGLISF